MAIAAFLADVRDVIVPARGSRHGPLPPLLISMTLVTGLVDAFSYLVIGHVFVANMTGNVVFLGFALAGAPGFSVTDSVVALVTFAAGALLGGRLATRHAGRRARLVSSSSVLQSVFLAAALVISILAAGRYGQPGHHLASGYRYALLVTLSVAMGLQNATARKIAVPDLTTTVLTLTITGVAADSVLAGGKGARAGRRLPAIAVMFAGALIGAELVRHSRIFYPLVIAFATVAAGAIVTRVLARKDPPWAVTA